MSKQEPQEADYVPNYKRKCIVCGQKPTITIKPINGAGKIDTDMCGACAWGESDALDPANW